MCVCLLCVLWVHTMVDSTSRLYIVCIIVFHSLLRLCLLLCCQTFASVLIYLLVLQSLCLSAAKQSWPFAFHNPRRRAMQQQVDRLAMPPDDSIHQRIFPAAAPVQIHALLPKNIFLALHESRRAVFRTVGHLEVDLRIDQHAYEARIAALSSVHHRRPTVAVHALSQRAVLQQQGDGRREPAHRHTHDRRARRPVVAIAVLRAHAHQERFL